MNQSLPTDDWNVSAKWIRILHERHDGLVEFEFAVGEPRMYVEMVMAAEPFAEFCAMHGVAPTHGALEDAPGGSEAHEWDWNLRTARAERLRHES